MIVTVGHGKRFHIIFTSRSSWKCLWTRGITLFKVSMESSTRTIEAGLSLPSFGYLVDEKTRAPGSPKAQPPHAPTDVQEGSPYSTFPPGLCSGMRFYLLFLEKEQKPHALQITERLVQFSPCSNSWLQKGATIICSANAGLWTKPLACHAL